MRHIWLSLGGYVRVRIQSQKYRSIQIMKAPVVLVTGASRGIGKAITQKFVQAGYQVFGTTRQASPPGTGDGLRGLEFREKKRLKNALTLFWRRLEESIS